MAMLYVAYCDASGKPSGCPVLTVGGAVAPIKKWTRLEKEWTAALRGEQLSEFHYTDFASGEGEFKGWKGDKHRRSRFLAVLQGIIKRDINKLFMASVEIDAWNEVNREYLMEEVFYSPYALCGYTVVKQVLKWAKGKAIKTPIEFIFEEGDDGWSGLVELCKRSSIVPIRLPKERAIPCQVADWIAWKNRTAATNALLKLNNTLAASYPDFENFKGILEDWESLNNVLVVPGTPGFYGREALLRTCKNSGIIKRSELATLRLGV